ncbi:hypothetical protein ACVWXO_008996 [Bradyrhizobium sp. LM2.7]
MPLGQSTPAWSPCSVYRASVVQRMRTRQRAQYVGSMIICWCSTCSGVVASSPRKRANSLQSNGATTSLPVVTAIPRAARIASALLPAHESYRHNGPSRAATVLPWPSGFSPSYMKFGTGSWRDVIVARRSRKSSASLRRRLWVSLRLSLRVRCQLTSLLWGNRARSAAGPKGGFATLHSFLLGIWSFAKSKPAAKSLLAHLSQPKAIEKMAAASGGHDLPAFDNLTTLKTSADERRRMVRSTRSRHPRSQCRSIPRAS